MPGTPAPDSLYSQLPPGVFPYVGALLIGAVVSSSLAGVTAYQTVLYFTQFPNDALGTKIWVFLIWLFDFLSAVFHSAMVCTYFVNHQDDPSFIAFELWTWDAGTIAMGLTTITVQLFFIVRIWRLRQTVYPHTRKLNLAICIIFITLALYTEVSGLMLAYMDLDPKNSVPSSVIRPLFNSSVGTETALDILITAMLIHILHQHRNEFAPRKSPFAQLLLFILTRGCVIAVYQVILLVIPHLIGSTYAWVPFLFCLSRVYANSAIMTLNNRRQSSDSVIDSGRRASLHVSLPSFRLTRTSDDHPLENFSHSRTDSYVGIPTDSSGSDRSGLYDTRSLPMPQKVPVRIRVHEIADGNADVEAEGGGDGDARAYFSCPTPPGKHWSAAP
ncbi:hypothetical protein FA95DRAFT_1606887 [Auriscalpium vulgare]|uniref:Uncharacterized protein n=1 Tax=Auriscalpium vulgare TaxID=40419 RepID=A0ACB8RR74_9AGAM|nr:hypothetical protein FA95DRAFT_1606887 [Auriscalpium vulgare]